MNRDVEDTTLQKSRGHDCNKGRSGELADDHHNHQAVEHQRHDLLGHEVGPLEALTLLDLTEHRDESHTDSAFGHESPEQVGDPVRNDKGIGQEACPEEPGHYHITDKTEDSADCSEPTDSGYVLPEAIPHVSGYY